MKALWADLRLAAAELAMELALRLMPAGLNRVEYARSLRIYRRRSLAAISKQLRKQTDQAQLELGTSELELGTSERAEEHGG